MERLRALGPFVLFAVLVGAALAAPEDLETLDQAKTSLYALDIYANGRWLVPLQSGADPVTKPPLQPWLAAAAFHATGGPGEAGVRAPSVLAALATLALTIAIGRRGGSARVAALGGAILVASFLFVKLAILARPDMLHALFTTAALLAALRGAWLPAFLALGLAALAKSPVAVAVFALALAIDAAASGEGRVRFLRVPWAAGLAIVGAIFLAWLGPALAHEPRLREVLLGEVAHHVGGEGGQGGRPLLYLIPHFVGKFLPWSLILIAGAIARPRPVEGGLRPEAIRLLGSWTVATLIVFSALPSKRSDYLLPALPAASLLVAEILHRKVRPAVATGLVLATAAAIAVYFAAFAPKANSGRGEAIRDFCERVRARVAPDELACARDVNASALFHLRYTRPLGGHARWIVAGEASREAMRQAGAAVVEVDRTAPWTASGNSALYLLAPTRP